LPMKAVFVINGLGAGGAERSLAEMLPLFEQAGVEPTIACLEQRGEGVQRIAQEQGFDVRYLGARGWRSRIRRLRALLEEVGPDLMHTTIFEADVIGRIAARRTGVPVVTSLVNTPYEPIRLRDPNVRPWRLAAVKTIDGWTARRLTTHFHAITHAVKETAVRDLRIEPDRITVVERGRDPSRLGEPSTERRTRARQRLELRARDVVLVTLGRQEFQKGQWHLLDAMVSLVAAYPDIRLLVGGRRGNASPKLEQVMRSSSLNGEVRFLGHRDDAPEVLAAADVFVFPSLYEGLGGSLIEAMALGLPIVASDLPAIREVVEVDRNALLVPPGSANGLAAAVGALIDDDTRRTSMGARSRQIFEERFTLERSARRMVELFERVAAAGRRPAA
jgi:glycosyltransferase involved in cell wall biosynthesis